MNLSVESLRENVDIPLYLTLDVATIFLMLFSKLYLQTHPEEFENVVLTINHLVQNIEASYRLAVVWLSQGTDLFAPYAFFMTSVLIRRIPELIESLREDDEDSEETETEEFDEVIEEVDFDNERTMQIINIARLTNQYTVLFYIALEILSFFPVSGSKTGETLVFDAGDVLAFSTFVIASMIFAIKNDIPVSKVFKA